VKALADPVGHTGPRSPEFALDPAHEAHEPPEARGLPRDGVRLLVSRGDAVPVDSTFRELGRFLAPGDLLVVNTSATIPAALDGRLPDGQPIVVHLSGTLPGDVCLVEARMPDGGATSPLRLEGAVDVELLGDGTARLLAPFADSRRLWLARLEVAPSEALGPRPSSGGRADRLGPVLDYARDHGRPIRYRHVAGDWPLRHYQTVFAREPGSAEMPSAGRPFSQELVTDLVGMGVAIAPLLLHTGVSSLEGAERPYPERYRVPVATASAVNAVRAAGGRILAAGTTVVRALATVTDEHGVVHPGRGWTDVVVTPRTSLPSVDGLLTGWHEPESSHLQMLGAFAAPGALARAYRAALDLGYLWHEFGDSHLILRDGKLP
jgi:S-adenosylmethionine:tRNA ribosyltransferase-isomerase